MPAPSVSNGSNFNYGTVNQSTKKQTITYRWYVSSSTPGGLRIEAYYGWGYSSSPSPSTYWDHDFSPVTMWVYPSITSADCDDNVYMRHRGREADGVGGYYDTYRNGGPLQTWAANPTVGTPTAANAAKTTIDVTSMSWIPATKDTAVDLIIQYKETSSGTWLDWGTQAHSNQTGYSTLYPSNKTITGLTPDTAYDFRLKVDRSGTANTTTLYYGSEVTLSTLPDVPEVTTNAATNLTAGVSGTPDDGGATLNATVDRNDETDLEWRFAYDETPTGGTYGNTTAWTASTSEPEEVAKAVSSLTESTEYGYRVEVRWDSGAETDEGSEVAFTVPDDPLAEAALEAHVLIQDFTRKYGVEDAITFILVTPSVSGSDTIVEGATVAAADCLISKDGGAWAQTSNQPTQVDSGATYTLTLTAAELQCSEADIIVKDAAGGPDWRDALLRVKTHLLLGSVDIDAATGQKADTTAFKVSGYGTGHGIEAVAGATGDDISGVLGKHVQHSGTAQAGAAGTITLAADAVATNDYYNNAIVLVYAGTGIGQSREITDYVGATLVATVDTSWAVNPDATSKYIVIEGARTWQSAASGELSAVPSSTSSYGNKIDFLFQRFAFKITQTATLQTWLKADASTPLGTRSVADDGTTQTVNALS